MGGWTNAHFFMGKYNQTNQWRHQLNVQNLWKNSWPKHGQNKVSHQTTKITSQVVPNSQATCLLKNWWLPLQSRNDLALAQSLSSAQRHEPSASVKRPSLFWDDALWNWDKQLLKKKKISSNIMLDSVKWSEMHYGLAWVVLDSPSIVWALVAGLSLLMLPHLFRSLDACRGFHLEKSRHEMTWERSQGTTIHGTSLKNCTKMCHFCRGSVTKQVLISLTLHQLTHLSGLGCSRLHTSTDATCPGTDSTSPFNKITQWRLKEKDRNNHQSKANWSKRPRIPNSPFTTLILLPPWT